jgi:hypothetical protein
MLGNRANYIEGRRSLLLQGQPLLTLSDDTTETHVPNRPNRDHETGRQRTTLIAAICMICIVDQMDDQPKKQKQT